MAFVNLLQAVYPVGSVYLSTVSTSPSSTIGGTWVAMTGGMLGLAGSTGVAEAASNGGSIKISTNQMPSHSHGALNDETSSETYYFNVSRSLATDALGRSGLQSGSDVYTITSNRKADDSIGLNDIGAGRYTSSVGGSANYIPAHTAVYGWRRTA